MEGVCARAHLGEVLVLAGEVDLDHQVEVAQVIIAGGGRVRAHHQLALLLQHHPISVSCSCQYPMLLVCLLPVRRHPCQLHHHLRRLTAPDLNTPAWLVWHSGASL